MVQKKNIILFQNVGSDKELLPRLLNNNKNVRNQWDILNNNTSFELLFWYLRSPEKYLVTIKEAFTVQYK